MGQQAKKRKHQEVSAENGRYGPYGTGENTSSRFSDWFELFSILRTRVGRKRFKRHSSWHKEEEEKRTRLSSTCSETPSILGPRLLGGGEEEMPSRYSRATEYTSNDVKESADICQKYAYNFDQVLEGFNSKTASETTTASEFPEPVVSQDLTTNWAFGVDDVNVAAAVLTLVSDICRHRGRLSLEDQVILRDALKKMPYLLTPIGRKNEPEEALVFQIEVYENPASASWGSIESFDTLQNWLELLERFDNCAELHPSQGPGGMLIV
ncbi:hypothetical protein H9Q69_012818 [Fusarium xylarioides]|uniref:Uncharacterized protein n=1 Tax=Fusarium xylarioides TaxID=221167 RepID=A0A9P7IBH7_9HYPO|nr:hypothetical protein H9Q70_011467 [Fusarium xylarioides]KAG5761576.1 hypothetical protein H9Q72_010322 [Fusarium xylarioides]KAG5775637.1 hypothetical protein H9Q73_010699 [Fusarium xylarioides]KAG5788115.1 hypothetical protein H9Q69_012818 [Fusarium xylarioides]KAG5804376.1 hypothetical protein H9Q71_011047 [Fusarium xylarioides]